MHIPDGYLGPQTYLPALGLMAGVWAAAIARLQRTLRLRQVPMLALGAAFSFMIMMFNVPIPGGTSGHAVGGVLVAILLGPWAAVVAVSLALIVQALIFGDGGITAIGANCFNMAVLMPFAGWGAYRLVAGSSPVSSARHWLGGALGGYLGLCLAAVATGIEFGIQPMLAHDAAGRALYCPFGLDIAVPIMAAEHLLVFGFVEGLVTALVIVYLQRAAPEVLDTAGAASRNTMGLVPKLVIALGVLALLTPLGLYLPEKLGSGTAWGEWSGAELKVEIARQTGGRESYIPEGLQRAEAKGWQALAPDYQLPRRGAAGLPLLSLEYVLCGAFGMLLLGLLIMLGRGLFAGRESGPGGGDRGAGNPNPKP